MSPATRPPSALLRLQVSIIGADPHIWRLLEVDAGLTLAELHDALQVAVGWRLAHLHRFTDEDPFAPRHDLPRIGPPPRDWAPEDPFGDPEPDDLPEGEWTLAQVFDGFDGPLYYEYDFGDGWVHLIELVERVDGDPDAPRAHLLGGEFRGPLEDSGGIAGYREKLDILADPKHPEHERIAEWIQWVAGPWTPFDSDLLDIDHINRELAVRFEPGFGMSGLPTDASPGDPKPAERVVGAASAIPLVPWDAAIIDVIERMPVPLRGELRGLLTRSGALEPADVDSGTAATMVEPFTWLVRRAGTDGIRLTQAGWMPPAVVSAAMHELGWTETWYGEMNRESQTRPIARLREDATRYGLLRKRNGVLHATTAARKYINDPVGLWRMLAQAILPRTRSNAERDIATLVALEIATGRYPDETVAIDDEMTGIVFGLEALGWADADGGSLSRETISWPVNDVLNTLDSLSIFVKRRWSRIGVTDGGRAFARAILRAPVQ